MIVKQASILYDRTQHATILGGLILLGKTTCYCCDTSLVLAHRPLIQIFIRTHVSQRSELSSCWIHREEIPLFLELVKEIKTR